MLDTELMFVSRIKRARQQVKRLEEQQSILEDTQDAVVRNYAQAKTAPLVVKMRSSLPREIRDLVYQHYWDDAERRKVRDSKLSKLPYDSDSDDCEQCDEDSFCPYSIATSSTWRTNSHLTDPECVGSDTAQEVALSYYQTTTMKLRAQNIESALDTDIFSLGLVPRDCIRSVIATLSPSEVWVAGPARMSMKDCFEILSTIRHKHGLDLRVRFLSPVWDWVTKVLHNLEIFRPYYFSLTGAGASITIYFEKETIGMFYITEWLKVDVSDYYTASMDEAQKESWLQNAYEAVKLSEEEI